MVHYVVEVVRKQNSQLTRTEILEVVHYALKLSKINALPIAVNEGYELPVNELESLVPGSGLAECLESITIYLENCVKEVVPVSASPDMVNCNGVKSMDTYSIFVYELDLEGGEAEYMDDNDEETGQSAASHHWLLPSRSFHGLWDSLIFDSEIKDKLVDYVKTAVMFANKGVNPSLISWNKVILLHGPPGTGKTSLCKALAQKAVIRMQDDFLYGQLIEVNSHSLFSKWFSESGKLVTKMFDKILELVEDPKALVFLLIDEVESLAQCRQSAETSNEPTDSIRAVNALLTQIDRLKTFPNVVILTTSNIVGSIDIAFVDRADLKLYIGPPPASVIYGILASCIHELLRVGIIVNNGGTNLPLTLPEETCRTPCVKRLLEIAEQAHGLSGRSLRKLPFLTFSNFFTGKRQAGCNLEDFLTAMSTAVGKEFLDRLALQATSEQSKANQANNSMMNCI